ncbi:hypothetical protein GCM10027592_63060 [Spirosoma flavus]
MDRGCGTQGGPDLHPVPDPDDFLPLDRVVSVVEWQSACLIPAWQRVPQLPQVGASPRILGCNWPKQGRN